MPTTDALSDCTLPVTLHPQSTALVIIDMMYLSACRTTGMGRWLDENGRAEEGRYRFDRIEQLRLPNIGRLLTFFRQHDLHRVHVKGAAQLDGARDVVRHSRKHEAAFGNLAGNIEYEILPQLAPQPNEAVVRKLRVEARDLPDLARVAARGPIYRHA